MRCRKCGASIPTDSAFCNYCGAKINRMPTRDGSMPTRPRDENFDEASTVREKKIEEPVNRGQRVLVILSIVLFGVLFAAGSVTVFSYMKRHQRTIINPADGSTLSTETLPTITEAPSTEEPPTEPEIPTESTRDFSDGTVFEENGLSYRVENETLTLVKCNASEAILVLPSEVEGMPLVAIGSRAFFGCNHLQYVDVPEGVTVIAEYAFSHCDSLREVVMPDTLKEFQDHVFDYTGGVTIISNPDTLGYWIATNAGIPWIHGTSITVISE